MCGNAGHDAATAPSRVCVAAVDVCAAGLTVGDIVVRTQAPLSVELGPGTFRGGRAAVLMLLPRG